MGLTPRSFTRARERLRLGIVHLRLRIHNEGWLPWTHNRSVRRVVLLWVGSVSLVSVLSFLQLRALRSYYLEYAGQPGGSYTEGIVGSITTINPILTDSGANADASRLVFSGLTRFNHGSKIEPDLAKSWTISPDGRVYTFMLRTGVTWQDGQPFGADDVVYTVGLIKKPDTRSPMASAWQGVEVTAPNATTVVMTLPVRYDAFINSTVVGILPKHILQDTPAASLRISDFNQAPIGTGPFTVTNFDTENGSVSLESNDSYYGGRPKLDGITLRVYDTQAALQEAFRKHQVMGMARAANSSGSTYGSGTVAHKLEIPEEVALFMRTKSTILTDAKVRTAISDAIDREQLVDSILGDTAQPLVVPALSAQLAAAQTYTIPKKDIEQSKKLLNEAGWKQAAGATRVKNGKELKLSLVTAKNDDYLAVSEQLARQLTMIGVKLDVQSYDSATLQRSYIAPRNYDLLLYGLNAGTDLDLYPYWHSSQIKSPGLNVSQYSSAPADKALESARATTNARVRQVRLKTFLDTWMADDPAAMLYTPNYLYVAEDNVRGIVDGQLVTPADRFYNVQNWTVHSSLVPRM